MWPGMEATLFHPPTTSASAPLIHGSRAYSFVEAVRHQGFRHPSKTTLRVIRHAAFRSGSMSLNAAEGSMAKA